MYLRFIGACFLVFFANMAAGATFKCSFSDGHIEYRGNTCPSGSKLIQLTESTSSGRGVSSHLVPSNPHVETLNRMFNEALVSGDLVRAKELAMTQQHWDKIRQAEKPRTKTEAELRAEKSDSQQCKQASRSYEIASGEFKQDINLIEAKKRTMYRACGMDEPTSINIGNTVNIYR